MLKTRIIGIVLVKGDLAVQSVGFKQYRPIGSPEVAISYLDRWGIDEIAVLHFDRDPGQFERQVDRYARLCRAPLSVGGAIHEVSDIKRMIQAGADKVVIHSALLCNPKVVTEGASLFGNQSIIVSIDAKRDVEGRFMAYTHSGKNNTGISVECLAKTAQELGAGEILIHSIDRDGSRRGYDLDLLDCVASHVTIPVIASGGASSPEHLHQALKTGVSAVAAANFFHFTEHSVVTIKRHLVSCGMPVRFDSPMKYEKMDLDGEGRITRYSDALLESLRFHYIPEEKI